MRKIIDAFTDLKVSRQRKWQYRHREQQRELFKRYRRSEKGKAAQRKYILSIKEVA